VQQALRGEGGPYGAYLDLALAIEQESAFDIRELSERLLLGRAAVNRALLVALKTANDLEP
jgi:EAL and modified HD-GYP domain-containing signal transduction protein